MAILLILVIKALIVVNFAAGFSAGDTNSYKYQLMEMRKTYQGEDMIQRLVDMLILAMNANTAVGMANNFAYGAGDGNSAQATTDNETCNSRVLSSDQVQDIQFQHSDLLYIVVNGQLVARKRHLDLYIELYRIVNQIVETTSVIDVWFSHVPCSDCIGFLELMFGSFTVKPILHVESLQYNGSNFDMIRDWGCLAKLTTRGYYLKTWEWDFFREANSDSCDHYSSAKHNLEYMTQKNYTRTLLVFLEGDFVRSSLAELCEQF